MEVQNEYLPLSTPTSTNPLLKNDSGRHRVRFNDEVAVLGIDLMRRAVVHLPDKVIA
jgi:hypothetical protein